MAPPPDDVGLPFESTTILFADVVESVRLVEHDEVGNVRRLIALLKRLAHETIPAHGGTVLERRGDGLLARFERARDAAACALEIHQLAAAENVGHDAADTLAFRAGIHVASIYLDDGALFGRGINLAARLAELATPGQTVMSAPVRDRLTDALDGDFRDLGEVYLKHVSQPVRAYVLERAPAARPVPAPPLPEPEAAAALGVTLAVLPLAGDGEGAALPGGPGVSDVFVDQLTAALAQSPVLRVISPLSAHAFRGRDIALGMAAQRLGADYVLGGTASERPGGLAARLELLHRASGQVVWQESVACSDEELLSNTSDVIAGLATAVNAALRQTELTIAHSRPLPNLAAHTLYLAAVTLLHRFARADFDRSRAMLEALRDRAPRNAAPSAWLARWHVFRIVQGWSDDVRHDGALARDCARRALDLDPDLPLALAMAGSVEAGVGRDMPAARDYYDRALAANPNEPLAWLLKGVAHGFMGEAEPALQASERSLQLSPLDPLHFYYDSLSSTAAMGARDYPRAIELAHRAIRANCMHGSAYRALAVAQMMIGSADDARHTVRRLLTVEPNSTVRQFLARAAVDSEQNQQFGRALAAAGLPPG